VGIIPQWGPRIKKEKRGKGKTRLRNQRLLRLQQKRGQPLERGLPKILPTGTKIEKLPIVDDDNTLKGLYN